LAPHRTRVCLIGPECTGKTTLAEQLSAHFGAPWVPEFAREYAERVARELTVDDVEPIARGQMALEDAAANEGLVILDTDLISTVVYARHYYGQCPEWIEAAAAKRKADLYLLTDIDVPWVADGLRDSAAPRESLYDKFARTLKDYDANVATITGERFAAAIKLLDSLRDRLPAAAHTPRR
jgi:NadR type nicotinamide-nucleotide adenylyltransferase